MVRVIVIVIVIVKVIVKVIYISFVKCKCIIYDA